MLFLAGWSRVGSITVTATSGPTVIGNLTMPADADTIWIRAQQLGGESPWPYGYGLLTWKTAAGRELGTIKCYGHTEGEVLRLGVGLKPGEKVGQLMFQPRSYNLSWVKASAAAWQLAFDQQTGVSGGSGGGAAAISGSFVSSAGAGLTLARVVFP